MPTDKSWKASNVTASQSIEAADGTYDARVRRFLEVIARNGSDMLKQLDRLGGFEAAMERGHGQTFGQQLLEIQNAARRLDTLMGEKT